MKKTEIENKLLAAAIFAVLTAEEEGRSLKTSTSREGGSAWSVDHRRMAIGGRTLFRERSKRSTSR